MNIRDLILKFFTTRGDKTISRKMLRSIMITVIGLILLLDVVIYWIVFDRIYRNTTDSIKQTLRIEASNTSLFLYRYMDELCILRNIVDFGNIDKSFEDIARVLKDHGNPYRMIRLTLPDGQSFNSVSGRDSVSMSDSHFYKEIMGNHNWMCFGHCQYEDVVEGDCYSLSLICHNQYWMPLGIITIYFENTELDNSLSKLNLNGAGSCLLVEGTGMVRRFSHDEAPVSMHISKFVEMGFNGIDTVLTNSFKRFEESHLSVDYAGESEFSYNTKTPIMVYYAMIPGMSQMALALAIPKYLFYKDYYFILLVMVILTLAVVIALFVVARRLTRRLISVPLGSVNKFTNDFADGIMYSDAINNLHTGTEMDLLKQNLKEMQRKVFDAVTDIRNYSQDISSDSVTLTNSISKVSEGAQNQSATVEEISVSVENISDIIKDNTDKALATSDNSLSISQDIQTVTRASVEALSCMQNVIKKAKIINEITHKTDILAVNAAVAASKAGEHGKTFAVVAEEIRKLSERCQKASQEINDSSAKTLDITEHSSQLIEQISPRIQENAHNVAVIADSCSDQLQKTLQIQQAIQQLVDITVMNSQQAEQLDVFSASLTDKLRRLNMSIDFFKLDDSALDKETIIKLLDEHAKEIVALNRMMEDEGLKLLDEEDNE